MFERELVRFLADFRSFFNEGVLQGSYWLQD